MMQNTDMTNNTTTRQDVIDNHMEELASKLEKFDLTGKYQKLPSFKHVFSSQGKNFVCFEAPFREKMSREDVRTLLRDLQPSNSSYNLKAAGKEDKVINTPYMIETQSHISDSPTVKITFTVDKEVVWIIFDAKMISQFTQNSTRKVTDSEYYYFGGISRAEIQRKEIPCRPFNGSNTTVSYYGGNKKCVCPDLAEAIIDHLKSDND